MSDDRLIEFLRSCVKSADQERDRAIADLAALRAMVVERAGEHVLTAWTLEMRRERLP